MKKIIIFLFSVVFVFAEGETKDNVNMDELFKQLDNVISSKKDKGTVNKEKQAHQTKTTLKRETNYQKFNEAAKRHHLFKAQNILKTVISLKNEYAQKVTDKVLVQRYSAIGNKQFAYVSSEDLESVIDTLKADARIYKKLTNFEKLLNDIGEFDVKSITKALLIVEQEILNILDMGRAKRSTILNKNEEGVLAPILLKNNKRIGNITVIALNQEYVTLQINPF